MSRPKQNILKFLYLCGVLVVHSACTSAERSIAEEPAVSRSELMSSELKQPVGVSKLITQRIEMASGVAGQRHYHPIPVVGYVVAGAIAYQIKGQSVQVLRAGDAFYEPAEAVVVRWENIGSSRAVFVANYLASQDTADLIIRMEQ